MARRGQGGNRETRLKLMGLYFTDIFNHKKDYPTVTQLARKFGVTTPTIYRDLETLQNRLGALIVPKKLKLGGKKNG